MNTRRYNISSDACQTESAMKHRQRLPVGGSLGETQPQASRANMEDWRA
jgi:hypothetical protein